MTINKHIEIDKIEKLAELREDENFEFRAYLKGQDSNKIDNIVHKLNREISNLIDCTSCGNCCEKLKSCVTDNDVDRLSQNLDITIQQIKEDYTEIEEGKRYFKHLPCFFLKNKKCTIYNDKPNDCESFPHLHKKDFKTRLFGVIENYSICPIVFNVFEKLKIELNFK